MALANFFTRAAQAASQVLQGFDFESFGDTLTSNAVGIAFDASAVEAREGRATLELVISLLSRLYPRIGIVATTRNDGIVNHLITQARAINPEIEIVDSLADVTSCVVVGKSRIEASSPFYVGSEGWIVRFSPDDPIGSADTSNPIGAGAAACFGAANVFRHTFSHWLPHGGPDRAFAMSLFDYEPNNTQPANPSIDAADLGESHLIGLGAIGNGAMWALSRMSELRGVLHVIDHEPVDLTNLQRYVLTAQADIGVPKVELGLRLLWNSAITVRPHQKRWGEYLHDRGDCKLERVAVAVDTAEDRCAIQASLPRWVANAWTRPENLGVSRHAFLGDQACMMCLYLPDSKQKSEDELVAEAIGMPEEKMLVRQLLHTNDGVPRPLIERIATALHVSTEPLLQFEGKPLRLFYSKGICGGIMLQLKPKESKSHTEVPMAFQSALAGIMLAAELVASAAGLKDAPPPVTTTINLLRPLGQYLSMPHAKHPSGRRICADEDYVTAYKAKYVV